MKKRKKAESRVRYYIRTQSQKRGWNVDHLKKNGDFLEEQEIIDYFPDIGLGLERPDFLVCLNGEPCMVIEAKNEIKKDKEAIREAKDYADKINSTKKYCIKIAVGVAGEEEAGFHIEVKYLKRNKWIPLRSHGYEISTIPSKKEIELALKADDGTTIVSVPSISEFIDSAIELSSLLRHAKIEAPLRPKVIGAIVLAMYQGTIDTSEKNCLKSINSLVKESINGVNNIDSKKKKRLIEVLTLTEADFDRLRPKILRVTSLLKRLNVKSVLQTDLDFLGIFYEAFLRYGYDNNALGIVFTPRHITKFCVDLVDATPKDRVIDLTSGTGGFLVAAFDKMMNSAKGDKSITKIKNSLYGCDTNPTIWALASLNMFFRGDGKNHIENISCFDKKIKESVEGSFTRSFLNPPFSQDEEPESEFIDASLNALEPEGLLAAVVKAGIFADDDNKNWRKEVTKKHSVLGVISLPEDLFYPTSAPTSIFIVKAHIPQNENDNVFMGRIWNDGFEKLKGRREERSGSQLSEIKNDFHRYLKGGKITSELATKIKGKDIMEGAEFSPQQWLPQPYITKKEINELQKSTLLSIYQTVSSIPDLADEVLDDFCSAWSDLPDLELNKTAPVEYFFDVLGGKSLGEKNYSDGNCPYISSGDSLNSIIRQIAKEDNEVFEDGGITVTAFGQAYIQPWSFMARGNGGSAVRVLIPKFKMGLNELIWFSSQINAQKWRFFYARMSIKSRLKRLSVTSPSKIISYDNSPLSTNLIKFRKHLFELSDIDSFK